MTASPIDLPTASQHTVQFELNGEARQVVVPAHYRLLDLLRDQLELTGTKEGCSVGVCGACSVLVDGQLLSACLLPAVYVDKTQVTTIEGLAPDDMHLSPLQDAFIGHGGFQCGICTPGQIIAATALLREQPKPTAEQVKRWMMGNLCRCTGYYKIIESVLAAADSDGAPVARRSSLL
ncbi:MAG TPA: (2Fe-2S)-binding protein [Chloroflexota bacterium]|jgi:carbon-monoxide dehydrogenase small subunit|nr:(2Fe-2S)-binding protein [Chloroflexota bacterium]